MKTIKITLIIASIIGFFYLLGRYNQKKCAGEKQITIVNKIVVGDKYGQRLVYHIVYKEGLNTVQKSVCVDFWGSVTEGKSYNVSKCF